MPTWIYVFLVLAIVAVPLTVAIHAWRLTRVVPPAAAPDDVDADESFPSAVGTSPAEPEVALRLERDP